MNSLPFPHCPPVEDLSALMDGELAAAQAEAVRAHAVGCPVCNKLALLALGSSGAITWFAPVQPYLATVALLMTAGALLVRLRGQTLCLTRRARGGRQPASPIAGAPR